MPGNIHNLNSEQALDTLRGLLVSLIPRASLFLVYADDKQPVWRSEPCDEDEIDGFIAEFAGDKSAPASARRTLSSGRTAIASAMRARNGDYRGALVAVFSRNAGKSSWFDPGLITQMLEPAVNVAAELLRLVQRVDDVEARQSSVREELKLVYLVEKKLQGPGNRHSGLAELVGHSGRFLEIAYSVLLVPSKRIRVSATHSSWKSVNRRAVDRYVIENLLPQMDGDAGPVVFEIASIEGADHPNDQRYQALLSPLLNADGAVEGVIAQLGRVNNKPFRDSHKRFMTHMIRKAEDVIRQSFDPMTGLMNRVGFEAQLQESGKLLRNGKPPHQLVYFDLDNLQLVNDTFSRDAGDAVLIRFAQLLEELMPANAVATRLTGDDFVVLMTHAESDEAMEFAREVRAHGDQLRYLQGSKSLQVTVSTGIAAFDRENAEREALRAARIACDAAKDHGRDRIEIHDQDDKSIIRRYDDMQLVSDIQRTLDRDEFTLMAQPIVLSADPAKEARYEILLRMNDGNGDDVPASAMISAAERYHMMPQVDRWVLSSTIRAIALHKAELERTGVSFAVNLSGQSLGDDEMLAFIEEKLEASSIPPRLLSFEITESAAVSNITKAQAFIARLRERGCSFSLDDFGAGLSSFAYLKNLKVDTLKIDGSFIRGIVNDKISQSMVAAITQVARVMELDTVAEYVEDDGARALLEELGVKYLQGHGFGKPAELSGVIESIVDSRKTA